MGATLQGHKAPIRLPVHLKPLLKSAVQLRDQTLYFRSRSINDEMKVLWVFRWHMSTAQPFAVSVGRDRLNVSVWGGSMTALCSLINFLQTENIYIPLPVVIELFIIIV